VGVWKPRRRANRRLEMRWEGWKRCNTHCNELWGKTYTWRTFQLVKKHERGDMPKSEWLDKLVFRRMSEIHAVRLFLSHFVSTAKCKGGGNRKVKQPLSLYRLATLRFPHHFQRTCAAPRCDCTLPPFPD
jgi:hypothetical protein